MPRPAGTAALALTAVLLTTGGCTGTSPDGAAPQSAPVSGSPAAEDQPDATADLRAALTSLHDAPFRFAFEGELMPQRRTVVSGIYDRAASRLVLTEDVTATNGAATSTRRIVIGTDSWVYNDARAAWIHVDLRRTEENLAATHFDMTDPVGLSRFTGAVLTAYRSAPGEITGGFDLSQSRRASPFVPLGAPQLAGAWSFGGIVANLDPQSRITSITLSIPDKTKAITEFTTTFSAHGEDPGISASAPVIEAPDDYYA